MLESYKWIGIGLGLEISVGTDSKSTAFRSNVGVAVASHIMLAAIVNHPSVFWLG